MKDNLFSANHRNQMVNQYGYTEAMTVTIEELIEDNKKDTVREYEQGVMDYLFKAFERN